MSKRHSIVGTGSRHALHNFEYADATARLAASGFLAENLYQIAKQDDDDSLWMLTGIGPATWLEIQTGVGTGVWSRAGTILSPTTSGDTVQAGDGTLGQPSYAFQGDVDTGFRLPSVGEIGVVIAGAQQAKFDATGLDIDGAITLGTGTSVDEISTDGSLSAATDDLLYTGLAVKTYCDNLLETNDALVFKGVIDCSTNPDYPAANKGHTYKVSVAGKIGGASGENVEIGDTLYCIVDSSPSGDQATVGSNWCIVQTNIDGAVIGPSSAVDRSIALFDGTTGKLIQDSIPTIDSSGRIRVGTGTEGNPEISFVSDVDTGIWRTGTNNFRFVAGATSIAGISSAGLTMYDGQILALDGTVAAPSYSFVTQQNTGIRLFSRGGGNYDMIFQNAGTTRLEISAITPHVSVNGNFSVLGDIDGYDCALSGYLQLTNGGTIQTTLNGDITLDPNGTGLVRIGNTGTPGRSPKFYTDQTVEFDGVVYSDNAFTANRIYIGSSSYMQIQTVTDDGTHFGIGNVSGGGNRHLIFCDRDWVLRDFDHDTQSANPTIFIHSVTDPNISNTEWGSLLYNAATKEFRIGAGEGAIYATAAFRPWVRITSEMTGLSPDNGWMIYNSDYQKPWYYNGTTWQVSGETIQLQNRSGGTRVAGDVVIIDTGNAKAVTTTTLSFNELCTGVVVIGGANLAQMTIAYSGIWPVKVTGAVSIGDSLCTSTTATRAYAPGTTGEFGQMARALEANASGTATIDARIGCVSEVF